MKSEETLFTEALCIQDAKARSAFLEKACGGDASLRQQVEALLTANDRAAEFMQSPAPALGVTAGVESPGSSPQDQARTSEPIGATVGPYKLLERIGEGGMGVVYMADQLRPVRRRVALKIIKPGMDSRQVIARFEAERQALAMMDHPSIARVLDAGTTDTGRPYFAMELVKGVPITEYCDKNNLTPRERLKLFVQVCQAVQHAHTKGVIHRDLKPTNILITLHDGVPVPKVIDFGIAKATGGAAQQLTDKTLFTHFAQMIGTPLYMSPEQAEFSGLDVDTRSDVYSLGVLLYELLTGTTPFDKKRLGEAALDEIRRIIREEEPPRPSTRLSTLLGETLTAVSAHRKTDPGRLGQSMRGELDWIVMKSLEKDRTRRYETANGLGRDVERYLADETVQACPPSAGYRFRKFARRNKPLIATTAMVGAALLLGTLISTWLAVRAIKAERLARSEAVNARTQARKAETEAAVSRAVNQFVKDDLLLQASPENEPDRDVKLRTVVDRAAEKVEARFPNQPHVEAAVRVTLGNIYESLGEYQKAEHHMQRAMKLRRAHLGDEHADTLAIMERVAWMHLRNERFAEAEELSRKAVESSRRVVGDEHLTTIAAMHVLATALHSQNRLDEAEVMARKVLDLSRRVLGEDHRGTIVSINQLASTLKRQRRLAEAETLYADGIVRIERVKGAEHPLALMMRMNLAAIYRHQRRFDLADLHYQRVLADQRKVLGENHPEVLLTLRHMASLSRQQGRIAEAISRYTELLERQRTTLGEQHLATLRSRSVLASHLRDVDPAAAVEHYRILLAAWIAINGEASEATGKALHELAYTLRLAKQDEEAEQCYRRVLALPASVWKDASNRVGSLRRLAELLTETKRFEEAEPLWMELSQWSDANPDGGGHSMLSASEVARQVSEFYESWGQPDKAERWRHDAYTKQLRRLDEKIRVAAKGLAGKANNVPTAALLAERGRLYGRGGRFTEALTDYRHAIQLDPSDHWTWFMGACLLAHLGDAAGHRAHCEQMLERFGESADPYICDRIAKSTLLLPPLSQPRLQQLDAILDRALAVRPNANEAWLQSAKVMADYRAGRYEEAAERADRWRDQIPAPLGQATVETYRSMAEHRLGHQDEAAAALAAAVVLAGGDSPTPIPPADLGEMFQDWLVYRIAHREAERLLLRPTTSAIQSKP